MKVSIDAKRGVLIIEAPISTPQASASGKTLVFASTRGNLKTGTQFEFNGQKHEVTIGLNAYIANPARPVAVAGA